MARRTAKRKGLIKYLLVTVIALLVVVSLLSLFVFKSINSSLDNVLGASTTSVLHPGSTAASLTCQYCAQFTKGNVAIVLQKEGTDSRTWGAKCMLQTNLSNAKNVISYILCPTPTVIKKPIITPIPEHRPSPFPTHITNPIIPNDHTSR